MNFDDVKCLLVGILVGALLGALACFVVEVAERWWRMRQQVKYFQVCEECGQIYDCRQLDEVLFHTTGYSPQAATGIKGAMVKGPDKITYTFKVRRSILEEIKRCTDGTKHED